MLLPPMPFIACGVILAVMDGAERNGELIAYLKAKPSWLRIADVVGVGGGSAANKARLASDKPQVCFGANSLRLSNCKYALINLRPFGGRAHIWRRRAKGERTFVGRFLGIYQGDSTALQMRDKARGRNS